MNMSVIKYLSPMREFRKMILQAGLLGSSNNIHFYGTIQHILHYKFWHQIQNTNPALYWESKT